MMVSDPASLPLSDPATRPPQTSLAEALQVAADLWPTAQAMLYRDTQWTFADWLHAAPGLACRSEGSPPGIWSSAGNALQLAASALAASLNEQAFQPLEQALHSPAVHENVGADTALIINTSGSEGKPRPIQLGKSQLACAAFNANQALDLQAGDCWLHCLPGYHIGGQSIFWRCAFAAATVLLHEDFSPARIEQDFATHPVSHISLVPAMLARLVELEVRPPASLRVALIGGAALSPTLHERAAAAGWPLYPSYGMTESAALIAVFRPTDGAWQRGRVGCIFPGHETTLTPEGRLQLRGPQIALSLANRGLLDADGWLKTSDLASIAADGQLTIHGRADDILISAGRNIHPLTVENCLAACPGVEDIAVTGRPDPVWGDLVVALVVGPVKTETLLAHARQHLPSAALPRLIRHLPRLPRNAAGKLKRSELRQLASEETAQ